MMNSLEELLRLTLLRKYRTAVDVLVFASFNLTSVTF